MSLPRFIDRVLDSTVSVLGSADRSAIASRLEGTSVTLRAGKGASPEGFRLAANLAARVYPQICLEGPAAAREAAQGEIVLINPGAELLAEGAPTDATLSYEDAAAKDGDVSVHARGWGVFLDSVPAYEEQAQVPAALLAAALGMGEVFRIVFAAELGERARGGPCPFAFDMITLAEPEGGAPPLDRPALGRFNLVGAGAIGQAAAQTLALCDPSATMVVIDEESVTLPNLQRYLLTRDSDVGELKVELLRSRLSGDRFEVVPVPSKWTRMLADGSPTLVALDSAEDRIAVQAGLPGDIYNAWTQPADVGWSRHEHFGEHPCLACLYWPVEAGPSRHEQIALAFRQDPHRCLAYLVHSQIPVDAPLPEGAVPPLPGGEAPAGLPEWQQRPLLDDIAVAAGVQVSELAAWVGRSLADLYQEGICAGAVLHLDLGEAPREALVPLAHQSAFAGIMLATQLLAAKDPALAARRSQAIEARYDLISGGEQVLARPRSRSLGCICEDPVYRDVYCQKFVPSES